MTGEPINDLLAQIIRVGFVVGRDEVKMRVRVEFSDTASGALVTAPMQVLVRRAKGDCVYDLPDIGDQVLCLFLPFGKEDGFVIGAMYGADAPPATSGDKWRRVFSDGTVLEYDRREHTLTADVKGDVSVTVSGKLEAEALGPVTASSGQAVEVTAATFVSLTAPDIYLNGNLTSVSAGGAKFVSGGAISFDAARISLNEGCE